MPRQPARVLRRLCLVAAATALPAAQADTIETTDRAHFLLLTGATQATVAFPDNGANVYDGPHASFVSGSVTFEAVDGALYFGDASSRLPGGELTIDGLDDVDLRFAAPVHSFGFDMVEPEADPNVNAPFVDTRLRVALHDGGTEVGWFVHEPPNDVASFVGVWSSLPFDRVTIREIVGGAENEFYGAVYTGTTALPVPEPGSAALWLLGLAATGAWLRRRA